MVFEYNKKGIRFSYPENWHLEETVSEDGGLAINVTSRDGAFWVLMVSEEKSARQLADSVLQEMQAEYRDLESVETTRMIAGQRLQGFDMDFMCFDLVNTAMVLTFEKEKRSYAIFWQADDQQMSGICEDVFNAMSFTLVEHLSK